MDGVKKRKAESQDPDGVLPQQSKKLKEVYLVNKKKYHSVASKEELLKEGLCMDDPDEDTHRIIQAKIR